MIQEALDSILSCMKENYKTEDRRSPRIIEQVPDPSGKEQYVMGIYLTSPDGEVFRYDESDGAFHIIVCFDCVLSSDPRQSGEEIYWLDKLVELIREHNFAVRNGEMIAVSSRADLGYPYNGFALALDLTVAYTMDGLY